MIIFINVITKRNSVQKVIQLINFYKEEMWKHFLCQIIENLIFRLIPIRDSFDGIGERGGAVNKKGVRWGCSKGIRFQAHKMCFIAYNPPFISIRISSKLNRTSLCDRKQIYCRFFSVFFSLLIFLFVCSLLVVCDNFQIFL